MAQSHPVEILMNEHRTIESVLTAFEKRIAALHSEPFPYEFLTQALDFFRNFADGCHHAKEEEILFPLLEARGISRYGGPIGCMLKDHHHGRECLGTVRANLDAARDGAPEALAAIERAGMDYVSMLRQHIQKEDQVLFQMAIRACTTEDVADLHASFTAPDNPKLAPAVRTKYEALAAELCASPGLAPVGTR